ncbi:MAG TPA: acyl-CoA reductase, partial [Chitinophagales bacterium]|nr:acyl-CoA reductase [Chitinophagales bacterium]
MKRLSAQKYLFPHTSTGLAQKSFLTLNERIGALAQLGRRLRNVTPEDEAVFQRAYHKNNWFTRDNIDLAFRNLVNEFLDADKLTAFAQRYALFERGVAPKTVGLVFAGNIPLVGFHDWLCVVLCGHTALVKLSSKDDVLFPFVLDRLNLLDPRFAAQTVITEQLKNFDAVIATGSNNSARYFEHYFGKYPHIIRRNRSAVAVVEERTTPQELESLADDVFAFFGLGCRNVSKLYLHQGVSIESVLRHFGKYNHLLDHNKYRNNYDYRYTI